MVSEIHDYISEYQRTVGTPEQWAGGHIAVGVLNSLDDLTDVLDFYPDSDCHTYICVVPGTPIDVLETYVSERNQVIPVQGMWLGLLKSSRDKDYDAIILQPFVGTDTTI